MYVFMEYNNSSNIIK